MYGASLIVIASVALMVLLWMGFLVWAFRSGQLKGVQQLRRLPLEDETPLEKERYDRQR